ncbi:MAG: hypothetical protein AB1445_05470 [Bacillota bacterium]
MICSGCRRALRQSSATRP